MNYRVNRAYLEDPSIGNPVYASIGKSAHNPLYQSSVKKRTNEDDLNKKVVDLSDEEKMKEKENSLVDVAIDSDTQETHASEVVVNLYDPSVHDKNDKSYNKENIKF